MDRLNRIAGHIQSAAPAAQQISPVAVNAISKNHKLKTVDLGSIPSTGSLKGKTLFVTGASRGIGLAIALRAARDGANIVIAAKTTDPDPRLPGTIFTAAKEIEKAGGKALPIAVDIRSEEAVNAAVKKAVETFGGIDILVNNASAISITPTEQTTMKKYDLMHQINARGTYLVTKACLPYLKKGKNPHVLTLSPPLYLEEKWFAPHAAYTAAKFGMSLYVLGHAGEFREDGIGVNALWPLTVIATAAVQNLLGGDGSIQRSRTPEIMADAAYAILTRDPKKVTGNFFVDEYALRDTGVTDFSKYATVKGTPDSEMMKDFFVE